jgi:hypothetical protein
MVEVYLESLICLHDEVYNDNFTVTDSGVK